MDATVPDTALMHIMPHREELGIGKMLARVTKDFDLHADYVSMENTRGHRGKLEHTHTHTHTCTVYICVCL